MQTEEMVEKGDAFGALLYCELLVLQFLHEANVDHRLQEKVVVLLSS